MVVFCRKFLVNLLEKVMFLPFASLSSMMILEMGLIAGAKLAFQISEKMRELL